MNIKKYYQIKIGLTDRFKRDPSEFKIFRSVKSYDKKSAEN